MCGIIGLLGSESAAHEAFLALTTLQHRGQDAAGILTYDEGGFHRVKNLGLVEAVFDRSNMATLTGSAAIGHARYSTSGSGSLADVQPFLLGYPFGMGLVHNGNIVNAAELRKDLQSQFHRRPLTQSDSEVVMNLLAEFLAEDRRLYPEDRPFDRIARSVEKVFARLNGSFSICLLIADHGLVAFRDPLGIRPLVWGQKKGGTLPSGLSHGFASESVALDFLGYENLRDVAPGELVVVDFQGQVESRHLGVRGHRPCMFEWIYFASPESVLDRVPVYGTRIELGRRLAARVKEEIKAGRVQPDVIIPVPETSRIAAIALSEELGIPYRETLIKNRYIKRTFILDSPEKRQSAVRLKLSPVRSEIEGKRVLLVDDSIVRGTTSRKIIELVRAAGAREVYFVSTCPPIQYPCFYGIDFPDQDELIAHGRTREGIEKELGADAVIYQTPEDLEAAITSLQKERGKEDNTSFNQDLRPCLACLNGKYPTEIKNQKEFTSQRNSERAKSTPTRKS